MTESRSASLDKWTLSHLQELIHYYASDKFPEKKYILMKNGSLKHYEIWPQWWARVMDRVEQVTFLELIKIIYKRMTGNVAANIGFADMYLGGKETELVNVLFLLHIYGINSLNVNDNSQKEKLVGYEIGEDDSSIINCADGLYKIHRVPIYGLYQNGNVPNLNEVCEIIRNRLK